MDNVQNEWVNFRYNIGRKIYTPPLKEHTKLISWGITDISTPTICSKLAASTNPAIFNPLNIAIFNITMDIRYTISDSDYFKNFKINKIGILKELRCSK
jgi:hypothetical protein